MQEETGRTVDVLIDGETLELKEFSAPVPGQTLWLVDDEGNSIATMALGTTTWWSTEPETTMTDPVIPDGFSVTSQPELF